MREWKTETEAREQIKGLVAAYYQDFIRPGQEKSFAPGDRIAYASRVLTKRR